MGEEEFRNKLCDRITEVLNRAIQADPEAMSKLLRYRVNTNGVLLDDPTIQIRSDSTLSIFGVINGLVGIQENGTGYLAVEVDKETDSKVRSVHRFPYPSELELMPNEPLRNDTV